MEQFKCDKYANKSGRGQRLTHTLWHAVTLQKKNVGAGGWLSARGQKVVVFTGESHR